MYVCVWVGGVCGGVVCVCGCVWGVWGVGVDGSVCVCVCEGEVWVGLHLKVFTFGDTCV